MLNNRPKLTQSVYLAYVSPRRSRNVNKHQQFLALTGLQWNLATTALNAYLSTSANVAMITRWLLGVTMATPCKQQVQPTIGGILVGPIEHRLDIRTTVCFGSIISTDVEADPSPQTVESAEGEETEDTIELWRHRVKSWQANINCIHSHIHV